MAEHHEVAIIGAGFSGIGTAVKLDEAGFRDWLMLEDGDGVGGAWHWNTYPGVGVDIPSFSYQFSFERRSDWSSTYAKGAELKDYAEHCVDSYGLRSRIRFGAKVVAAVWDEERHVWLLATEDGDELTARFLVGATGVFNQPKPPEIPGLGDYAGEVMHTSRWDHGRDLRGRRVAIVGTGASSVQVVPSIAPEVEHLTVFQRTPIWCLPKADVEVGGPLRWALDNVPLAAGAARALSQAYVEVTFPLSAHYHGIVKLSALGERAGRRFLAEQVRDSEVREKLTPKYGLGCKRPGFSNDYLRTFNRDNVALETTPIERFTAAGVRTEDGIEHAVEALILATGFKVFEDSNMPPYPVRGVGGIDLGQWWDENRFQAYEGVSVPGFPNLFTILGPYGYNGSSYFQLIETRARHIVRCLRRARERDATLIDVRREANDRFFAKMLARRKHQIFWQDTCAAANSYYFDRHGDVPIRPSTSVEVAWRSARFDLDDYRFERAALPAQAGTPG